MISVYYEQDLNTQDTVDCFQSALLSFIKKSELSTEAEVMDDVES
jgi:hypothetical protein